jgi:hypothetical protein
MVEVAAKESGALADGRLVLADPRELDQAVAGDVPR